MPEAHVFVHIETGEPTTIDGESFAEMDNILESGVGVEELRIASEWSLRIAAHALQAIRRTTTCPQSRYVAEQALRALTVGGDLATDPATGLPTPIKLEEHERPDTLDPTADPYKLWRN